MNEALRLEVISFKKGAYITIEGKRQADRFYIIRSGQVRLSKEVEVVSEQGESFLSPGDFFGIVSTMSGHSHIETAQAMSDVSLISIRREQYGAFIERNNSVALKIIESFSRRMRYLDEALTRLTQKGEEPHSGIEHLFDIAEYYMKQNQFNQAYYAYHQYIKFCPEGENIEIARSNKEKIRSYQTAVYLEEETPEFTRNYPRNTMIFSETMPGQQLYIVQSGQVKITKILNNNEILLAMLKAGDIFGEMSLLENKPRSASAIAFDDSVLLAVNRMNFHTVVTNQPKMVGKITTLMSERMWFIYKQLANTLLDSPVGKLYDALLMELEKNRVNVRPKVSYSFAFGTEELIHMVGLSAGEGKQAVLEMMSNKTLQAGENKIFCSDVDEIQKQAEYFRKMQRIARNRRQR